MPIMTNEIKELIRKVRPYMDGCRLREDAPDDIRAINDQLDAWFHEVMDGVQ